MSDRTASKQLVAGLPVYDWGLPAKKSGKQSALTVFGLPGLGGSGAMWQALAEDLPEAHVLSFDMRGRGSAANATGPTGLRAHAKDVAAILEELDLTDVVLVGHSFGAFLAPLVAEEAPHRVKKVVLIDGGVRTKFPFFMNGRLIKATFKMNQNRLRKGADSVEALIKKAKFDKTFASFPHLKDKVYGMLAVELVKRPDGTLAPVADVERCSTDAADAFFGPDVEGALRTIKVPAHLIVAENKLADGQSPFIADAQIKPFKDLLGDRLTVTRLKGNHVTVVFEPAVLDAVRS